MTDEGILAREGILDLTRHMKNDADLLWLLLQINNDLLIRILTKKPGPGLQPLIDELAK